MPITKTKEKKTKEVVEETTKKKPKSKKGKNNKFIKKIKKYVIIFGVLAVLVLGSVLFMKMYNGEEKADTEYLNALVKESSELTTAKLNFTGMTEFEDEGIKFLNRSDFTMVYEATLRAGIDVKKVKVTANDAQKIIYVSIPAATIQDVKVKPNSIKYYDEEISLFNTNEKEDVNKAQDLAEKEAFKEAKNMGILKLADQQAETLIKGILANAIPDGYKIKINNK